MTLFLSSNPTPAVATFTQQEQVNTTYNDLFTTIARDAQGAGDTFYQINKINNTNNGLTLLRSSKQNLTAFIISNLALNIIMPLPADIKSGDCFRFCVTSGNPTTYNITLNLNGNLVNGSSTAIVIATDKVIEFICLDTGYLKGLQYALIA